MKKRLFLFHSWLGLIAGLGLIVIGLTGSALVFKSELDALLVPALVNTPDAGKPRLGLDALVAAVKDHLPDHEIRGWQVAEKAGKADQFYVTPHGTSDFKLVYVDPSTGAPQGTPMENDATLTNWLLELHYSFLADHTGEIVAGIIATLLCALGITGVILYRNFWKTLFQLRWGKSGRMFFSDLHKMVGISSTIFNLILGSTGAWWNLSHILGHMIEGEDPEPPAITGPSYASTISFDSLLAEVQKTLPGFQAQYVGLPGTPEEEISFYGSREGQGILRSPYGNGATFDPVTGALKTTEDIRKASAWNQVLDSFRPLHYGTFGGLPVKILWCLGGLAPGILAVSGAFMYFKRRYPARRKASAATGTA